MLAFIKGTLFEIRTESIVVEVNGLGMEAIVSLRDMTRLPRMGSSLLVFTYLQVLDNEFKLYGFIEHEELDLFQLLMGVSGIGARAAMNILSHLSPGEFYTAVASQDEKTLTRVPGIGKKTAQRLMFELKDKVKDNIPLTVDTTANSGINEILEALEVLGYGRNEVFPLLVDLQEKNQLAESVEDNIKLVLKLKARSTR
ncbi:Holliday junction branch migration protein RuvA [Syntrophomonas erecta]